MMSFILLLAFSACPRPAVGRIAAEFRSADIENSELA